MRELFMYFAGWGSLRSKNKYNKMIVSMEVATQKYLK